MESKEYQVVAPKRIEEVSVDLPELQEKNYVVKVTQAQVCDADAKYYFGLRPKFYSLFGFDYLYGVRDKEGFMKKYPLVLLHEAVGVIEKSGQGTVLEPGTRVVLVPSRRCSRHDCEYCNSGNDNSCRNSKFMSSNAPGFARTRLIQPEDCVARIPDNVPNDIAVHTEMSTVAYAAIIESGLKESDTVAVFGDGYLGYIHACENQRGIPGSGLVPWTRFFEALRQVGYDGCITIESFDPEIESVAKLCCIWRKLADSPEQLATEGLRFLKDVYEEVSKSPATSQ